MQEPTVAEAPTEFWSLLHAALGLQLAALRAAEAGDARRAWDVESEALQRLAQAGALIEPGGPEAGVIRALAAAGMGRMAGLRERPDTAS